MLFESKADGSLAAHATQARELELTQPLLRAYGAMRTRRSAALPLAAPRPAALRAVPLAHALRLLALRLHALRLLRRSLPPGSPPRTPRLAFRPT